MITNKLIRIIDFRKGNNKAEYDLATNLAKQALFGSGRDQTEAVNYFRKEGLAGEEIYNIWTRKGEIILELQGNSSLGYLCDIPSTFRGNKIDQSLDYVVEINKKPEGNTKW